MNHIHLNTANAEAQLNFWCGILMATRFRQTGGVRIPGAAILLNSAVPSAGTAGSVVDHIGFQVNSLAPFMERLEANGVLFVRNPNGVQAMVSGPDGVRVELAENRDLTESVAFHHVHFHTTDVLETQRWYAENLGARRGKRMHFEAADLPGVNLTFSPSEASLAATEGRALDHIGFDVVDLPALAMRLNVPYLQTDALGLSAFLTDPWGTRIELTQGFPNL